MAAADTAYKIERGTEDVIRMTAEKIKDGRAPSGLAFELRDVPLGIIDSEGIEINSAVLEPVEFVPNTSPKMPSGKRQREALAVLEIEIEKHAARLQKAGLDPSGARVTISEWKGACVDAGIDRRRAFDAIGALIGLRAVVTENGGFVRISESETPAAAAAGSGGITYPPDKTGAASTGLSGLSGQNRQESGKKPAGVGE